MGNPFFSFDEYANSLAEILRQNRRSSFVVAITGTWGCGKTTLMNLTLDKINQNAFVKTSFNAWRYTKEDAVWRGFFTSILSALQHHVSTPRFVRRYDWQKQDVELCQKLIDDTEKSLYTAFSRETLGEINIDTGNLAKSGLKLALRFVPWGELGADWIEALFKGGDTFGTEDIDRLWGIFKRSVVKRQVERLTSMEQFRLSMEQLLDAVLRGNYRSPDTNQELKAIPEDRQLQLIVAVDDLDRCLPEQALEIFEAIKLFIDLPRTYFLIAIDQDVIQHALDLRYKQHNLDRPQIRAEQYIEKMIDLSFAIPSVLESNFKTYIASQLPRGDKLLPLYDTLKIALPVNLRTWERFAAKADFSQRIIDRIWAGNDGEDKSVFDDEDKQNLFLKLQCLAYQWPELFRKIGSLETYFELERCTIQAPLRQYPDPSHPGETLPAFIRRSSTDPDRVPERVWEALKDMNLTRFIRARPLIGEIRDRSDLEIIFSLDQ